MSKQAFFSRHLAEWLHGCEWHFKTLLAVCIDVINNMPDDADNLVNQLLLTHPEKPPMQVIDSFIHKSAIVRRWFAWHYPPPEIAVLSLSANSTLPTSNKKLPDLQIDRDVADWLDLSPSELVWLSDIWRRDNRDPAHLQHYHYSLSPKRRGGYRLIESPKRKLKTIQRLIYERIIRYMPIHSAAYGFLAGKNCRDHASLHVQKQYVIQVDLSDCFQSCRWPQVYRAFTGLGYCPEISRSLAALCTHRCLTDEEDVFKQLTATLREKLETRHLPQGAPSSPGLSNAVLFGLDKRLAGLAKKLSLTYSRYADDIVFSSDYQRDWQSFCILIGSICLEEGFELNFRKTRVMKASQQQRITGIIVNDKTNIDRRYYDRLKATLHNCARFGLSSQNRHSHPYFRQHLFGSIQYVKSLNLAKGTKLEQLFAEIPGGE